MRIERAGDALLVVDLQHDFLPGGALAVAGGDVVIAPLAGVVRRFATVVATQDWHPAGHVSFASAHPPRRPYETLDLPHGRQELWPDHCVQGSPGRRSTRACRTRRSRCCCARAPAPTWTRTAPSARTSGPDGARPTTGLGAWLRARGVRAGLPGGAGAGLLRPVLGGGRGVGGLRDGGARRPDPRGLPRPSGRGGRGLQRPRGCVWPRAAPWTAERREPKGVGRPRLEQQPLPRRRRGIQAGGVVVRHRVDPRRDRSAQQLAVGLGGEGGRRSLQPGPEQRGRQEHRHPVVQRTDRRAGLAGQDGEARAAAWRVAQEGGQEQRLARRAGGTRSAGAPTAGRPTRRSRRPAPPPAASARPRGRSGAAAASRSGR